MSNVIGFVYEGVTYLAGDQYVGSDNFQTEADSIKLMYFNHMAIGMSGGIRAMNVVGMMTFPDLDPDISKIEYVIGKVIYPIQAALEEARCLHVNEGIAYLGGTMLIAMRETLFIVQNDFSVYEVPYGAIGSASEYAYGAMSVAMKAIPDPERIVEAVMSAVAVHCPTATAKHDMIIL